MKPWQVWIDTGGTFTDCVARDPTAVLHRAKVLSNSALRGVVVDKIDRKRLQIDAKWPAPSGFIVGFRFRVLDRDFEDLLVEEYDSDSGILTLNRPTERDLSSGAAFEVCSEEEAPILAARLVTRTLPGDDLPDMDMRLASTRGTNALLEHKGVPVALFITKGFGDLLRIGTQQRPDIFALEIHKPEPFYQFIIEVEERLTAEGSVLKPIELNALEAEVDNCLKAGLGIAAVVLMHSYRNPSHEQQLARWLCQCGFKHVSCSSEVAPFIRIVPRGETTVIDAYLAPVIKDYLDRVLSGLNRGNLHVMTSAGGLMQAKEFRAKDSLLSGPAGGVVGAALAGRCSGFDNIIAFDMGGTSTDVARFDGDYEYVFEHEVGDAHLVATALAIESVAAGGGSICKYDGYRLLVGPESASAQPGPACYGAGGPLTVTDVNLLLGRLDATRFEIPVSRDPAEFKLRELVESINKKPGRQNDTAVLLQGLLDIANERMADAIRRVSVRKGYDPKAYTLVAFGGAGGQHACAVARRLEILRVVVPKDASLLSALGLGHAVVERFAERQVLQPLDQVHNRIDRWFDELTKRATEMVATEGVSRNQIETRRRIVNLRFLGQNSVLSVEYAGHALESVFRTKYKDIFGHLPEGRQIEVESLRAVCSSSQNFESKREDATEPRKAMASDYTDTYFEGEWREIPVYERAGLFCGAYLTGPALIFEQHSTTVVELHWRAQVDDFGALVLNDEAS